MANEKFDVIVVGAGAAGLGAAYALAKKGFSVVVLERGERVGAKNVFGGRIYSYVFEKILPEFRREAPIERWVEKERLTLMTEEDALAMELSTSFRQPYDSFTSFLSKFDNWLSKKVEEVGGFIITGYNVDSLYIKDGKVLGIISGSERLEANVVIDAEGVNPMLAQQANLRGDWRLEEVAVGVKEVVKMPRKAINERFNVNDSEGVAQLFVGYPTKYARGGGFLYTMGEYVTLGVVVRLKDAVDRGIDIYELAENLRNHPYVSRLLSEGDVVEYSAHLVPEVGLKEGVKLYGDGILLVGDAAGFVLNTGFTVRGVDLAFWSGVLAAEAYEGAHNEGKYDRNSLSIYEDFIKRSFIYNELNNITNTIKFLDNIRLYEYYPKLLIEALKYIYTVDERPKRLHKALAWANGGRFPIEALADALWAFLSL